MVPVQVILPNPGHGSEWLFAVLDIDPAEHLTATETPSVHATSIGYDGFMVV
jgi:hypothetical protein